MDFGVAYELHLTISRCMGVYLEIARCMGDVDKFQLHGIVFDNCVLRVHQIYRKAVGGISDDP